MPQAAPLALDRNERRGIYHAAALIHPERGKRPVMEKIFSSPA
jgi:hypothetical protein